MQRFFGEWCCDEKMYSDIGRPSEEERQYGNTIFAVYERESYEGQCLIVFKKWSRTIDDDGKSTTTFQWYVIEASHCSCNGLEDAWPPKPTTKEALLMMELGSFNEEVRLAFKQALEER